MRRITLVVLAVMALSASCFAAASPARRALYTRLPELKFTGVSLSDSIDFLRDVSGANLHVNWRALESLGVGKDTSINLRVRGVTLEKALNMILSEAGAGDQLAFYVDQGVIEVTTREIADRQLFTKVYPIGDLLLEIPDFQAPQFNLQQQQSGGTPGSGGGGGGGSSQGLFQNNNSSGTSNQQDLRAKKKERADGIVNLIVETIRPEIWRQNGGPASVSLYNENLIITAPRSVHEAIGGVID